MHTDEKSLTFKVPTAKDKGFVKFFEKIMALAESLEGIKTVKDGAKAFKMIRDVIGVLREQQSSY